MKKLIIPPILLLVLSCSSRAKITERSRIKAEKGKISWEQHTALWNSFYKINKDNFQRGDKIKSAGVYVLSATDTYHPFVGYYVLKFTDTCNVYTADALIDLTNDAIARAYAGTERYTTQISELKMESLKDDDNIFKLAKISENGDTLTFYRISQSKYLGGKWDIYNKVYIYNPALNAAPGSFYRK